jgi:hypothetical protein
VRGRRYSLGYGAVDDTTRRRKPLNKTGPEIAMLTAPKRERASATARDDRRNFTILAWMVRRHLDCVSRFTPHVHIATKTAGAEAEALAVKQVVRKLLAWHSRARQFDALGLHGRDRWMRMFEACKVLSGDCGGLKSAGGKLQGIEGDRIARPGSGNSGPGVVDGRLVSEEGLTYPTRNVDGKDEFVAGPVRSYCVCRRAGQRGESLEFESHVDAADMIFDGYFPERFDSARGVSPLLTALNEGADIRETWEWLVLKAKASALFGLAFTRTSSDPMDPTQGDPATSAPSGEGAAYSAQIASAMKSRGLLNLDLDPGDSVSEIESKTPNPQVVSFTRELIRSVLLALDIPFTFYDSLTASFSARIADRNEYEESCEPKREQNISVLDEAYGGWLFPIWAESDLFGFGKVLKNAALDVEEVAASVQWVPAGRPWLDRSGEMSGHILALAAGVTSVPRICAQYGEDAYEIAAEQKEFLEKSGIPLLYAQGGQFSVQSLMAGLTQPGADAPQGAGDGNANQNQ